MDGWSGGLGYNPDYIRGVDCAGVVGGAIGIDGEIPSAKAPQPNRDRAPQKLDESPSGVDGELDFTRSRFDIVRHDPELGGHFRCASDFPARGALASLFQGDDIFDHLSTDLRC